MSKSRLLASAALVATAAFGVGVAQAQETQVSWSITIGSPVAVLPVPSIVRPAPVIVQPSSYAYFEHRGYRQPTRWDVDGDGIPNRYDRVYNPAWDRDGDGIPDNRDRFDNRRVYHH